MLKTGGVRSVRKLKAAEFGPFALKFLELWPVSSVSVVHEVMPPAAYAPPVVHRRTDELVYMLSGSAVVRLGRKKSRIQKGDYLVIPKGTAHSFRTRGARMEALSVFSPPMDLNRPDAYISSNAKLVLRKEKK